MPCVSAAVALSKAAVDGHALLTGSQWFPMTPGIKCKLPTTSSKPRELGSVPPPRPLPRTTSFPHSPPSCSPSTRAQSEPQVPETPSHSPSPLPLSLPLALFLSLSLTLTLTLSLTLRAPHQPSTTGRLPGMRINLPESLNQTDT